MKKIIYNEVSVPYSAGAIFNLINDVYKYPEFLPWCYKTQIHSCDNNIMIVSMGISKGRVKHTITTENSFKYPEKIEIQLISGPLKYLHARWLFDELSNNSCKVKLHLEYMLNSKFLDFVLNPVIKRTSNKLTCAFIKRAEQVLC